MKRTFSIGWIVVFAISAYGAYYGASRLQKESSIVKWISALRGEKKADPELSGPAGGPGTQPKEVAVFPVPCQSANGPGCTPGPPPPPPPNHDRPVVQQGTGDNKKVNDRHGKDPRKECQFLPSGCGPIVEPVIPADPPISIPAGHNQGGYSKDPRVVAATSRMGLVAADANTQLAQWKLIKDSLPQGIPLSSSISSPLNRMTMALNSAQTALKSGDAAGAESHLDSAQASIDTLEAAWKARL